MTPSANPAANIPVTPEADNVDFVIDGDVRFEKFTIKKKGQPDLTLKIVDCSGTDRGLMLDKLATMPKISPTTGKPIGINSQVDFDLDIVSYCLCNMNGELLGKKAIEKLALPGSQLAKIAQRCLVLCDLDASAGDREKKD